MPPHSSALCQYPFMNLMLTANGQYTPCCRYHERLKHNGRVLQAPADTPADAWNSSGMIELRTALLQGEKPLACKDCWEEEASGIQSVRLQSFGYAQKFPLEKVLAHPQRLDIYPGNTCNLQCRICSGPLSSSLIPEHQKLFGITEKIYNNLDDHNISIIDSWTPYLFEIGLFGGEPLLAPQTLAIVKNLSTTGQAKHIRLMINTNCTVFDLEFAQHLSSFQKVFLNFSLDDIHERLVYQRKGLTWGKACQTIKQYLQYGGTRNTDTVQIKICCTVSLFNIYYLPEYLTTVKEEFGDIQIYFNFLHLPEYYCIFNLPASVKNKITTRLKKHLNTSPNTQAAYNRTLEDIINFCQQPAQIPFDTVLQWLKKIDTLRNEKFENTFTEYWRILNERK